MFNNDISIKPYIFQDEINEVIEEKGNQFTALRVVEWLKEGEEPNKEKGKLELRRWIIEKDGTERANKGLVFMTKEGPHQLTETLVNNGFGDTKNIIKGVLNRDDAKDSITNLFNDNEEFSDGEYFDMRDMLLSYSETESNNNEDDSDDD